MFSGYLPFNPEDQQSIRTFRKINPDEVVYRILPSSGKIVAVQPPHYPLSYKLNEFIFREIVARIINMDVRTNEGYIRNPIVTDDIVIFELLQPNRLNLAEVQAIKQMYPQTEIKFDGRFLAIYPKSKAKVAAKLLQNKIKSLRSDTLRASYNQSLKTLFPELREVLEQQRELKRKLEQEQSESYTRVMEEYLGETSSITASTADDSSADNNADSTNNTESDRTVSEAQSDDDGTLEPIVLRLDKQNLVETKTYLNEQLDALAKRNVDKLLAKFEFDDSEYRLLVVVFDKKRGELKQRYTSASSPLIVEFNPATDLIKTITLIKKRKKEDRS